MTPISLSTSKALLTLKPDMKLVMDLEDEIGSLPDFYTRLINNRWKLCELVSFYHILLSLQNNSPDYMQLGNSLLSHDVRAYQQHAISLLEKILPRTPA